MVQLVPALVGGEEDPVVVREERDADVGVGFRGREGGGLSAGDRLRVGVHHPGPVGGHQDAGLVRREGSPEDLFRVVEGAGVVARDLGGGGRTGGEQTGRQETEGDQRRGKAFRDRHGCFSMGCFSGGGFSTEAGGAGSAIA